MPTYTVQAPDGHTYSVDGPAGASQEDVQAEVLRQNPQAGAAAAKPGEVAQATTNVTNADGTSSTIMAGHQIPADAKIGSNYDPTSGMSNTQKVLAGAG